MTWRDRQKGQEWDGTYRRIRIEAVDKDGSCLVANVLPDATLGRRVRVTEAEIRRSYRLVKETP